MDSTLLSHQSLPRLAFGVNCRRSFKQYTSTDSFKDVTVRMEADFSLLRRPMSVVSFARIYNYKPFESMYDPPNCTAKGWDTRKLRHCKTKGS